MQRPPAPGPDENSAGPRARVNRVARTILGFFAAPRVDMREDYQKVRRFQRHIAVPRGAPNRALDYEVPSDDGTYHIPVRVFHPKEQTRDEVLVFFHGGGWVIGDVESYTPTCVNMADLTGAVVVSVDYRLAPEYPFPAGLEDCYQIIRRLLDDPTPVGIENADNIVLIGDSAGANLAAVVSLLLRNEHPRGVTRQILLYPVTHWDHNPETSPFDSVREHGNDLRLTNAEVQAYFELYVPDAHIRKHWKVVPLMAQDLTNQPRTLIITAELDLLRDEGEAYGRALLDAGNSVHIHRVDAALHGFIVLPRLSRTVREAYEVINAFLDADRHTHPEASA